MHSRLIRDLVLAAAGVGLAMVASACAIEDGSIDGDNGALGESDSSGQADAQQEDGVDGVDQDQPSAAASCSATRRTICHESDNNCSYPEAKECDPVPRVLDRVGGTSSFPISGSGHVMEDSLGNEIGVVTDTSTRLNFGQRRVLHGTTKVMAFAAGTTVGARSGWINESAIGRDLSFMPTVHGRDPGGSYSTWHVVESDNSPYLDSNGESLKVVRTCGSGRNATDYLGRNGHVNVIFNLPGYDPALGSGTIDSYPNNTGIVFHRAQAQHSLDRPLYSCASGSPVRVSQTLSFLYGYVEGASTRRGWVAQPNLRTGG
jgi:hypothetical protein